MAYNILVGEKIWLGSEEDGDPGRWSVRLVEEGEAPRFDGDEVTGKTNRRQPSYLAWRDFCVRTDLGPLFFDKRLGLMRAHPGCADLESARLHEVERAFAAQRRANPNVVPGWLSGQDQRLARLEWLAWWMRWALEHCRQPAIANS